MSLKEKPQGVGRGAPGRWGEGAPIRMAGQYAVVSKSFIEKVKVRSKRLAKVAFNLKNFFRCQDNSGTR